MQRYQLATTPFKSAVCPTRRKAGAVVDNRPELLVLRSMIKHHFCGNVPRAYRIDAITEWGKLSGH